MRRLVASFGACIIVTTASAAPAPVAMPPVTARPVLFDDAFATAKSAVPWRHVWGKFQWVPQPSRANAGALQALLQDDVGLSVHFVEFDAEPGAYTASVWVFVPPGQPGDVHGMLSFRGLKWELLALQRSYLSGKWTRLQVVHRVPAAARLRVALSARGKAKTGDDARRVVWDDFRLERGAPKEETMSERIPKATPADVIEGLQVRAREWTVRVSPGKARVDGKVVTVEGPAVFTVTPPPPIVVRDESKRLGDKKPVKWRAQSRLEAARTRGICMPYAILPDTVRIKSAPGADGITYTEGKDYFLERDWAGLCRLAGGRIQPQQKVFIDYEVSRQRLDTVIVRGDGRVELATGEPALTCPHPPAVRDGLPLANIYIPLRAEGLTDDEVFPIGAPFPEPDAETRRARQALIPKTLQRLHAGGEFRLVAWGDSVTVGGDASSPDRAWAPLFAAELQRRYPQAHIRFNNAGIGGSNSRGRLPQFEQEVMRFHPHLVVIEFVNDMGFPRDLIFANYQQVVERIRETDGEVIILTPHFTMHEMMGFHSNWERERRPAVRHLREFCAEHRVPLADASRRWEHLCQEGLPYLTLLHNGINHPDDRGHRMFVDELLTFFDR